MELRSALAQYRASRAAFATSNRETPTSRALAVAHLNADRARLRRAMRAACAAAGLTYRAPRAA